MIRHLYRTQSWCCCHHISVLPCSVGFFIQNKIMDAQECTHAPTLLSYIIDCIENYSEVRVGAGVYLSNFSCVFGIVLLRN